MTIRTRNLWSALLSQVTTWRTMATTAFVLTGGASLGAVHVGMLEALYEVGVAPQLIVGTSVGAINGAYIASRPQTPATARALGEVWRGLKRADIFPLHLLQGLLGFVGLGSHFVPSRALRRLAEDHLDVSRLEEYPIPLHVIATDALTGDEVRLSAGDTTESVLASAAIAGVFPSVTIGAGPSSTVVFPTTRRSLMPSILEPHPSMSSPAEAPVPCVELRGEPSPCFFTQRVCWSPDGFVWKSLRSPTQPSSSSFRRLAR